MTNVVIRRLILFVVAAFGVRAIAASEKPADTAFEQSALEFTYQIPPSFTALPSEQMFVPTPMGDVPARVRSWRGKQDGISVKATVMPEVWWQTRSRGAFAEAKENLLKDSSVNLIEEHDYSISGCPAHSIVYAGKSSKSGFHRIDLLLVKPNLWVVLYVSPEQSALNGTACKKLFDSISIKPKQAR